MNFIDICKTDESTAERLLKIMNGLYSGAVAVTDGDGCLKIRVGVFIWYSFNNAITPYQLRDDIVKSAQVVLDEINNLDDTDYDDCCNYLGF